MTAGKARADCPNEEEFARLLGESTGREGLEALLDHLDCCEACRELAASLSRRSASEVVKRTTG
jgi:hypothetical protein